MAEYTLYDTTADALWARFFTSVSWEKCFLLIRLAQSSGINITEKKRNSGGFCFSARVILSV